MKTDSELLKQQDLVNKSKLIELKPVISSNVAGIGYDADNKLLKVAFNGKDNYSYYLYENVNEEQYNSIISAESVGKKLTESVIKQKEKHNYIRL